MTNAPLPFPENFLPARMPSTSRQPTSKAFFTRLPAENFRDSDYRANIRQTLNGKPPISPETNSPPRAMAAQ